MTDERRLFLNAVRSFWDVRTQQALTGGGEGSAGAVRAGKHFDVLCELVAQPFLKAGFKQSQIRTGTGATLPGYYRPSKNWDLVVLDGNALVAAVEFKALGGPAFGNNFNNRAEEALGNAADVWQAFQVGILGTLRPWLGYFYLIEDSVKSRTRRGRTITVRVGEADPEFQGRNYVDRAEIMCRRLLRQRRYDAVCFVASSRNPNELPIEPDLTMSWDAFSTAIDARLAFVGRHGAGAR